MTTTLEQTTIPAAQAPPPVSAPEQGTRPFPLLRHCLVLAGRAVRKIRRTPEQIGRAHV